MKKYELTQYEFVKVRVDHKPNFPVYGQLVLLRDALAKIRKFLR